MLAKHTGQPIEKDRAAIPIATTFTAGEEAVKYGLVDKVLTSAIEWNNT